VSKESIQYTVSSTSQPLSQRPSSPSSKVSPLPFSLLPTHSLPTPHSPLHMKSWLVIGCVTLAITLLSSIIRPDDAKWFRRLQRPQWLTFEKLIPVIWTIVFIGGGWSAYIVWEQTQSWAWMIAYIVLELVTIAFTPALFWSHSLKLATYIGGTGFLIALGLAIDTTQISVWAAALLIPYLLWSPIGTATTWQMNKLNPQT